MDSQLAAHTLEFLVYGLITVLAGGQWYLWIRYNSIAQKIARMEQEDVATSRTLTRMEGVLTEINKTVHDLDRRLAVIEDRALTDRDRKE